VSVNGQSWYRNMGDGTFGYVPRVFGDVDPGTFLPPELDGDFDGDVDVVRRQIQFGTFLFPAHIWRNNGGGAFPTAEPASDGTTFFFGTSAPGVSGTADFDADGDLDGWNNDSNGWWDSYRNTGNGWFDQKQHWTGEEVAVLADFDQDGWLDAAVTNFTGGYPVRIRRGSPSGLGPATAELGSVQAFVPILAAGDLNSDGRPDLAFIDLTRKLRIYSSPFGAGSPWGLHQPSATVYDGSSSGIAIFDVNGDLLDDVVVGSHNAQFGPCINAVPTRDVYLRVQAPPSAVVFEAPRTFVMGSQLQLDLDGDSDLDLIGRAGPEWYVHANRTLDGVSKRRQFGNGAPGASGAWPTLGASGPFEVGASPTVRLTGAQAGLKAFLAVGLSSASLSAFPLPGMTTYVDPFGPVFVVVGLPTPGTPGVVGSGSFTLPVNVDPSWVGLSWYHQAFPLDTGLPGLVSATNGLELVYGP